MRYVVAHGRRSGRGNGARLGLAAVARLRAEGHDVTELVIDDLAEARARSAALVAEGVDVLAVAGGDGMVSMAANLCVGTGTALGILPAGTGNDAARGLGISTRPAQAIDTLVTARRRRIDTLRVVEEDRHVVGSVTAALDARMARRGGQLPKALGGLSYTLAVLIEIARLPWTARLAYRLTTTAPDGAEVVEELDTLVLVPANLGYLGGGLHLVPDADPCDGLMDLVLIRPVTPRRALAVLRAVRAGRHAELAEVEVRRTARVRIEGPADVLVHGDGEPIAHLPLTVEVAPASLQVVVPPLP